MAAMIKQTDKRTGITYAYESLSHWDKEKQQSRAKRTLIGRVNPQTGEIVPTRKKAPSHTVSGSYIPTARTFCGATYLLDQIGKGIGITEDLKECFPNSYKQILSVAYFLILEGDNPMNRFAKWAALHKHPFGENIPSQRSSELFASITEEARMRFFSLQGKRRAEGEYWAYDTTSISSYSECLKQVKYGVNKENDRLPQINLAMLFGETSNLPFYYRKLPGNITDVMTVKTLLAEMSKLGYHGVKLVMDKGFYSEDNINALYKDHLKFIIAGKMSLNLVKKQLDSVRQTIRTWTNFSKEYHLYATSILTNWEYSQKRPYKGDTLQEKRRLYLHVYFNAEKYVEDERRLNWLLLDLQEELTTGRITAAHERLYAKYFDIEESSCGKIRVIAKQEAIDEAKKNYGYFVLLSNEVRDPIKALELYRNKDVVEKAFGDIKDRLNMRRLLVSSDLSLDGKLFVEFVALIYLSYIKRQMQSNKLFSEWTMQSLLDELDVIECLEYPRHAARFSEITKKQTKLFEDMNVKPPSSLC